MVVMCECASKCHWISVSAPHSKCVCIAIIPSNQSAGQIECLCVMCQKVEPQIFRCICFRFSLLFVRVHTHAQTVLLLETVKSDFAFSLASLRVHFIFANAVDFLCHSPCDSVHIDVDASVCA